MNLKPIEWKWINEATYWLKQNDFNKLLNCYTAEELKMMEENMYRLWTRLNKTCEMKQLMVTAQIEIQEEE